MSAASFPGVHPVERTDCLQTQQNGGRSMAQQTRCVAPIAPLTPPHPPHAPPVLHPTSSWRPCDRVLALSSHGMCTRFNIYCRLSRVLRIVRWTRHRWTRPLRATLLLRPWTASSKRCIADPGECRTTIWCKQCVGTTAAGAPLFTGARVCVMAIHFV